MPYTFKDNRGKRTRHDDRAETAAIHLQNVWGKLKKQHNFTKTVKGVQVSKKETIINLKFYKYDAFILNLKNES